MSKGWRIASIVAAALVGSYLLAALVLPPLVNADRWRPQVESRLTELVGRPVRLQPLRLSLWTGVTVRSDGLRVGGDEPAGRTRVETGAVSVRPRLLSLLRGKPHLRTLRLDDVAVIASSGEPLIQGAALRCTLRPSTGFTRIEGVVEGRWGGGSDAPALASRFDVTARSGSITIESLSGAVSSATFEAEGTITGLGGQSPHVRLTGSGSLVATKADGTLSVDLLPGRPEVSFDLRFSFLDFDEIARAASRARSRPAASLLVPAAYADEEAPKAASVLGGVAGSGKVTAERGRLAGIEIAGLTSAVEIGEGEIRFDGATFDVHRGKARADVVVAAGGKTPFHVAGRVDGVDVGSLVKAAAPSYKGGVEGTASLELDVSGEAGAPGIVHTLRGSARLAVRDGKLETFGILEQVRSVLEMAGGRGIGKEETPFERLTATFDLSEGSARTQDLELRSPDLDLDGRGAVDLAGPLKMQVVASFSKEASADLVQRTPQLKLRMGADGRLTVPLSLRGTLLHPQVKLDLDRVLQEGLRQSVQELGKKSLLRKLLGKD